MGSKVTTEDVKDATIAEQNAVDPLAAAHPERERETNDMGQTHAQPHACSILPRPHSFVVTTSDGRAQLAPNQADPAIQDDVGDISSSGCFRSVLDCTWQRLKRLVAKIKAHFSVADPAEDPLIAAPAAVA